LESNSSKVDPEASAKIPASTKSLLNEVAVEGLGHDSKAAYQ
jgi:hypothetical protein